MADLQQAQQLLQERRISPIWSTADQTYKGLDEAGTRIVIMAARTRVLRYLAAQMGLDREEADPSLFTLEQCRQAWQLLGGVSYWDVREWATKHRAVPMKAGAAA